MTTLTPDHAALAEHAEAHARIDRHAAENIEEVRRFLRVKGFSDTGEGMEASATAGIDYLRLAGATDARGVVTNGGNPVLYGKTLSKNPNAKTLAVYSLYDMTPVDPAEWRVDPNGAEIIDPARIDLPSEMGSLICSRASSNHRAPMLAFILAVKTLLETEGVVPVNLVWIWDGEEELGSPTLPAFVEQHTDELRHCDALHGPSMYQAAFDGPMVVSRGLKGALLFELHTEGGEWGGTIDGRHAWAANQPFLDAPMMRLIHAVGSLYDAEHMVAIDGVADTILPLAPEDTEQIEAIRRTWSARDEDFALRVMNTKRLRGGAAFPDLLERWVRALGVNVQGITGGYQGPTFYTMLPQRATAKLDLRLPPGPTTTRVLELIREHLDRRGFHDVQIRYARGYEGHRTTTEDPIVQSAIRAAAANGVASQIWPTANAFCPASLFVRPPLNIPSLWTGLGHGERMHQPEEYIEADGVRKYMHFAVSYLWEWARAGCDASESVTSTVCTENKGSYDSHITCRAPGE